MADVITRFKLETTQYDSKLRDAAKGLKEYTHQATMAGNEFAKFTQKNVEAARAFGTIATSATNSKDKVKELVGAFNDVAKAYNALTKEQQQSDFGKALAESMTTLKGRIAEAKQELYDLGSAAEKVKSGGGLFGGKSLTDMLSVAGGNLIASGISKLTSELTETVQQSIELARSGEGVRLAFDRLNRPDLLANLKEATHGTVSELELMKAAVKFDDFKLPVEQLGTLLAFAQKKAKDTGQSVDYMVDSIVTGLGRKSLMILDNLGLSAAQIKDRMAETGDMTTAVASIIKEQMSEAGEYVETAADRAARAAADAQNQMEELGRKAMPVAEEWGKAWNEIKISGMEVLTFVLNPIAESLKDIRDILSGEYTLKIKADIPNYADDDGKNVWSGWKPGKDHTVQAPGGYVEVTDKNTGAVIGGQHFDNLNDANAIKAWQKTLFKTPKTGGAKKTPTTADFEKFIGKEILGADALKGADDANFLSPYNMMLKEIKKNILDVKDADLGSALKIPDAHQEKIKEMQKNLKAVVTAANTTATVVGSIGEAFNAIEDPAAKVAGTVMQAIASVALGYAQATVNAASMGPWAWIAFAASGLATMLSTISSIHSATGYAQGGMIKGNSYSGDNIGGLVDGSQLVGLNAGEVVLNAAGQRNVAAGLQNGGGLNGLHLVATLKGRDVLIQLERELNYQGRGELVTWGQ